MKTSLKNNIPLLSFIVGIAATIFLIWLIYISPPNATLIPQNVASLLPYLNGLFNLSATVFLIKGYRYIKQKNKDAHIKNMILAFVSSTLFLLTYILYHHVHGDTLFLTQGPIRFIYFFILITHILLSILGLPFILMTFLFALNGKFETHKKIARLTFPVWLYVSITGVLIIFLLKVFN